MPGGEGIDKYGEYTNIKTKDCPKVKFLANIDNYIKLNEPARWLIAFDVHACVHNGRVRAFYAHHHPHKKWNEFGRGNDQRHCSPKIITNAHFNLSIF